MPGQRGSRFVGIFGCQPSETGVEALAVYRIDIASYSLLNLSASHIVASVLYVSLTPILASLTRSL